MTNKKVAIVIPAHKNSLNEFEIMSLKNCNALLPKYDKIIATFDGLDIGVFKNNLDVSDIVYYDKDYFKSIDSYNALMKNEIFYKYFLEYEYILIFQTDCYLFDGNIEKWTDMNYSYIGAPWINKLWLKENYPILYGIPFIRNFFSDVGNGGLSLRRVSDFYILAKKFKLLFKYLNIQEDILWSNLAPRINAKFKIPDMGLALKFAFDYNPAECYKLNNNEIPFGCHGWYRYDLKFWKRFINIQE